MALRRVAIVMAGGSGERFWPVSTRLRPKQFLRLAHPDQSLIQQAVERARKLGDAYVATNLNLADQTLTECPGLDRAHILAEPHKRNTLGCLVWVAASLSASGQGDAALAVLTADQSIEPMSAFIECCDLALSAAEHEGGISVIGIPPTRPETGFGYVESDVEAGKAGLVHAFREKPDLETAISFVESGRFLWNSGMFFLTLSTLREQIHAQHPEASEIMDAITGYLRADNLELAHEAFAKLPSLSFDKAVMEKAPLVHAVRATFDWDDLGSWDSLRRAIPVDSDQNATVGASRTIEASGNSIYVEGTEQTVHLLGVDGLVVVVTKDSILVLPESRAQEVKRFLQT